MKVLIAEDDELMRFLLKSALNQGGYEVVVVENGAQAWCELQTVDPPQLAILDWMMPEMDGIELCRRIRRTPRTESIYTLLLTARDDQRDIVEGLESGADDYITKPFNTKELNARVRAGARITEMQRSLTEKIEDLTKALAHVKQLQGIIPICSYCKSVRADNEYWQKVDEYISEHSEVKFSHGICPQCYTDTVEPMLERYKEQLVSQSSEEN